MKMHIDGKTHDFKNIIESNKPVVIQRLDLTKAKEIKLKKD